MIRTCTRSAWCATARPCRPRRWPSRCPAATTCWSRATWRCTRRWSTTSGTRSASAVAILSILGAVGGILIRRALLLRIHDIGQSMTGIVRGSLRQRLPTQHRGDELNALSRTINGMLDQMEQLIHGIRDVSNAIAHDLRTPLAELRSRLEELALTQPARGGHLRRDRSRGGRRRSRDRDLQRAAATGRDRQRHAPLRLRVTRPGRAGGRGGRVLPAGRRAEGHPAHAAEQCGGAGARGPGAAGTGARQSDRQRAEVHAGRRRDRRVGAAAPR